MIESKFALVFRHWLKANPSYSSAFEVKSTEGKSIPFNCLEPHQATYLQAIKSNKGTLIRVQGTGGEPDYVYLRNCSANVVVRIGREFHLIDVDTWLLEAHRSPRKSLTGARAREISIVSVSL